MSAVGWFGWALCAAVFAALTAVFAKVGLRDVDADFATLLRTAVIVVLLAAFVAATGKWSDPLRLPPRTWGFLVLSALATGASWVCYFRALQLGAVSQVAPVDKLSVVFAVLLAVVLLGERPTLREWTAVGLITGGVLLLAFRRQA